MPERSIGSTSGAISRNAIFRVDLCPGRSSTPWKPDCFDDDFVVAVRAGDCAGPDWPLEDAAIGLAGSADDDHDVRVVEDEPMRVDGDDGDDAQPHWAPSPVASRTRRPLSVSAVVGFGHCRGEHLRSYCFCTSRPSQRTTPTGRLRAVGFPGDWVRLPASALPSRRNAALPPLPRPHPPRVRPPLGWCHLPRVRCTPLRWRWIRPNWHSCRTYYRCSAPPTWSHRHFAGAVVDASRAAVFPATLEVLDMRQSTRRKCFVIWLVLDRWPPTPLDHRCCRPALADRVGDGIDGVWVSCAFSICVWAEHVRRAANSRRSCWWSLRAVLSDFYYISFL